MKYNCKILLLSFVLCACGRSKERVDPGIYFDEEIRKRIAVTKELSNEDTSLINCREVHQKVNDLILISRDVENLSASVNLANAYFKSTAMQHGLDPDDFPEINTGMHVDEIAIILRQNELGFFNQLIIKMDSSGKYLYTAQ